MDHDSVKCCGFELEPDITGGLSLKGGELDGGIRLPEGDYIVQQVYKKNVSSFALCHGIILQGNTCNKYANTLILKTFN